MRIVLFIKLFRESYLFAISAIIINKLRTILSLLGITIGIFTIISVFTVFDSLKAKINSSIQSLGNNALYVQKWPWAFGGDYPWWKYINRPVPKIEDMEEIKRRSNTAQDVAFGISLMKTAKYLDNSVENAVIVGVSEDYDKTWVMEIGEGRFFTETESQEGKNVAIIGSNIAKNLYINQEPLGRYVKLFGRQFNIVGVFNKTGNDLFGGSPDDQIYIPVNFCRKIMNLNSDFFDPFVVVKAKPDISVEQMREELRGILRSVRKLKPAAEDNFALNESSMLTKGFDSLFGAIGIAGWIIGGFSILVGGFGIANIMFVSVKERTNMIGIQKSLGAKRYFILFQFLFEAVFLSVFGGILGLLLVSIGTVIASHLVEFDFTLNTANIILGLGVSVIIGFISGFIPAYKASRLDPVVAIRTN